MSVVTIIGSVICSADYIENSLDICIRRKKGIYRHFIGDLEVNFDIHSNPRK